MGIGLIRRIQIVMNTRPALYGIFLGLSLVTLTQRSPAQGTLFLDQVLADTDIVITADIWYGDGSPDPTQPLYLDVYQPVSPQLPAERPALVYIHGGAFVTGDKADQPAPRFCYEFAQRGYLVVSINYTLDGTVNSATQDAAEAIRWLKENAATYQVDADRVIVGGHSAGGATSLNIGALESNSLGGAGAEVAGVINSAGADFVDLNQLDLDDPPMFIINGTLDNLSPVGHSRNLVTRLDNLADPTTARTYAYSYMEVEGAGHAFIPGDGLGVRPPPFLGSPQDEFQGWNNTEVAGQTVEEHCFEFFFGHLNLIEILAESPVSFVRDSGMAEGGQVFRLSIQRDDRIVCQLTSSQNLVHWGAAAEVPVPNGSLLEVEIPTIKPKDFFRWDLSFSYTEVTSHDYDTF
jgi:predicted esterase